MSGESENTGNSEGGEEEAADADGSSTAITEGSLARSLFQLAWPIVVIQLLQVSYNIFDTFFLGRLSADAVGAINLTFPIIFLLLAIAGGFTTAGAILVAQYTGKESDKSAGLVAGQTIFSVALLAVVVGVVGYFYTRSAFALLPSNPETSATIIPLAVDYLKIIFAGIPLMFGFSVFAALMRGYGDTRTPMFVMTVSVVLNVLLDPLLIFGFTANPFFGWLNAVPVFGAVDFANVEATLYAVTGFTGWGIRGAAVATILSRGVATLIGIWILFRTSRGPDVRLTHLVPEVTFIEDLVRLGVPSTLERTMDSLAMVVLMAMVVTFPPPVVAAYGLGNRLVSLVLLPVMGLSLAIDTMVGQNLGAGMNDRAERAVWHAISVGVGAMAIIAVGAATFTDPIVSVFLGDVPNAAATIDYGVEYVRIRSVEFVFIVIAQVILGAFRGAGNTRTALIISVIGLWLGSVVSVFYLVFVADWGATGIWIGMVLGHVLGAVVGAAWFTRGTWKEAYVDETGSDETVSSS